VTPPAPTRVADCNRPGCGAPIRFAVDAATRKTIPLDDDTREAFSVEATGCKVLVSGQAWLPADLIRHFETRFAVSESAARELVGDYPWHRPHQCAPAPVD